MFQDELAVQLNMSEEDVDAMVAYLRVLQALLEMVPRGFCVLALRRMRLTAADAACLGAS